MTHVFPVCSKTSDFHKLHFLVINNELRMIFPPPWSGSSSQLVILKSGKCLCCLWCCCPNAPSIFSLKKHDLKGNYDPGGDGH